MIRRCRRCKSERFIASQKVYMDVIVDGNGFYEDDLEVKDAENPYGPYTCSVCGAEYESLEELPQEEGKIIATIHLSDKETLNYTSEVLFLRDLQDAIKKHDAKIVIYDVLEKENLSLHFQIENLRRKAGGLEEMSFTQFCEYWT